MRLVTPYKSLHPDFHPLTGNKRRPAQHGAEQATYKEPLTHLPVDREALASPLPLAYAHSRSLT